MNSRSTVRRALPLSLLVILLGGGTWLSGCADSPTHKSLGQAINDRAVTTKVEVALIANPTTKVRHIKVQTYRGVVELSGFVTSTSERSEALRVARHQPGVHRVQDNLQLQLVPTTVAASIGDGELNATVKAALLASADVNSRDINVVTSHGIVQLSGFVDTPAQRTAVGAVAQGVPGVVRVDNGIQLKPPPEPKIVADNDSGNSSG